MIKLPPMMSHPEPMVMKWSPLERAAIRARDIEVAKLVLEAAAKVLEENAPQCSLQLETFVLLCNAVSIRALEVTHD